MVGRLSSSAVNTEAKASAKRSDNAIGESSVQPSSCLTLFELLLLFAINLNRGLEPSLSSLSHMCLLIKELYSSFTSLSFELEGRLLSVFCG